MNKLKLSTKLIGGFASVILMMIVIIFIYQYALSNTSSGFEQVVHSDVATLNKAAEIDALMQQARRYEKEFLLSKSLIAVESHGKTLDTLIIAEEEISRLENKNNNIKSRERAQKIITETNNYRKHFEQLVQAQKKAGLDSSSGLQGVFQEAAQQIANSLIEHDADDLLLSLLQVRRTEMKFLMSDKDIDKDKYLLAIDNFTTILEQSACDPVAKKTQKKYLKKYTRWLQEYFETDDTVYRDDIKNSMRELALTIEEAINSIRVPNTEAMLLLIRKNEKDFLLSRDRKFYEQTHESINNLLQAFEQSKILPEHVTITKEQLSAYQDAFDAMATELEQMDLAQNTMNMSVQTIEPLVKEIYQASKERSGNSTNALLANSGNMSKIAIITGFIALLIASAIALVLARSITAPIQQTVHGLTDGAEQVSAAASHISTASQSLADGSTNQSSALEQTSASMEELTSMTSQNADNANHADSLMKEVLSVIDAADSSMGEMSNSMEEISKASEETSEIVKTIDEIAFQTNLLALNAAVEAARAGEAGAGFAVVADEVRNLAMRAAEAAQNTSGLIAGIVSKVVDGKQIVTQTNSSFAEVAQASSKVGNLVAEISNASKEQAQGIDHINGAITQMETVTQQNTASAEESAAASEELNSQADIMMNMVHALRSLVEGGSSNKEAKPIQAAVTAKSSNPQQNNKQKSLPSSTSSAQKVASVQPSEIIPMDEDDDFEDF